MVDIFLRNFEANPPDIRLTDPTQQQGLPAGDQLTKLPQYPNRLLYQFWSWLNQPALTLPPGSLVADQDLTFSDWSVPRGAPTRNEFGWINQSLALTQTISYQPPLSEWAVPRGALTNNLYGWTNQSLSLGQVAQPFSQDDWPNPRGAVSNDLKGWVNQSFIALTQITYPPFVHEYGVPQGTPANNIYNWINQSLALGQVAQPFSQGDWPNPRAPERVIDLRTWESSYLLTLIGQDQLPVGEQRYEQRPDQVRSRVDWIGQVPPTPTQPFNQEDWPNPRAALRSVSLLTWLQGPVNAQPFAQYDWQAPRAPERSISLRTWINSYLLTLIGQDQLPVGERVTDVPRGPPPLNVGFTFADYVALGVPPTIPNSQFDWPVPKGPFGVIDLRTWIDPLKLNLQGKDTFFGLAGHPNYDWPDPRGAVSYDLRGWLNVPSLALNNTLNLPFDEFDWPVPRGAVSNDLKGWLNQTQRQLIGQDQLPFRQNSWPNPAGPIFSNDLRNWIYYTAQALSGFRPFNQYDWPDPRGAVSYDLRNWISNTALALNSTLNVPFDQLDWPNPRGATGNDLKGWINQATALNPPPAGAPFVQDDWPLPRGAATNDLRGWLNPALALNPPVDPPRNQLDWPVPRGPTSNDLRGWINNTSLALSGTLNKPLTQFDWANPRGATTNDLRGWLNSASLALSPSLGTPFDQLDWPVPRGPTAAIDLRTWVQQLELLNQGTVPFNQYDWANPRGAQRAIDLSTWLNQTQRQFIGQDRLPFTQDDWPVPAGYTPSVSLKSWLDPLKLNLLGKDTFFGLAGAPQFNWPNPRGAAPTQDPGMVEAPSLPLQPPPTPPAVTERHQRYFFADVGRMMSNNGGS